MLELKVDVAQISERIDDIQDSIDFIKDLLQKKEEKEFKISKSQHEVKLIVIINNSVPSYLHVL